MCGRFTNRLTWLQLVALYRITEPTADRAPNLPPRYNIAPTQEVPIVCSSAAGRVLMMARWGLVPPWANDVRISAKMINARAEIVATSRAFRTAFVSRRCLVPADGFYEWAREGIVRQPYHFTLSAGIGFAFAGLWEIWPDQEGRDLLSCTIVTTAANELVRLVDGRMPVILHNRDYETWLSADEYEAAKLMQPFPAEEMVATRASRAVNSYKNDGPELLVG